MHYGWLKSDFGVSVSGARVDLGIGIGSKRG